MKIRSILNHKLHDYYHLELNFSLEDTNVIENKLEALGKIDPEVEYDFEIKRKRNHRSNDANAYMWVLADKIADVINSTSKDVYRKAIHEVGVFHYGMFRDKDVNTAVRMWTHNGVGWIADVEPCSKVGCKNVKFYHGSSSYDTKQMSRLIDYLVEEAKGLNIETLTPDEIARLKEEWKNGRIY